MLSSCSSSNASNDLPDIYFSKRSSFPSITVSHCSDSVKFVTHILGYSSTFCLITIYHHSKVHTVFLCHTLKIFDVLVGNLNTGHALPLFCKLFDRLFSLWDSGVVLLIL